MLNEASKLGIQEILSTFNDDGLFSLTTTVTQGLLKNRNISRAEAVEAILNCSSDVISVLRRKAITREILFSYLNKKSIPLSLPATKADLIETIANYWDVQYEPEASNEVSTNTADSDSVSVLAEQFSEWFYSMLNSSECIDHEHFYADAKLRINMASSGQVVSEFIENDSQKIAQQLFLTKIKYNLFFNPNVSKEGVQGRIDQYGLVMVLVCGTLHTNGVCVGLFEQAFGLVRDPLSENNWRIKSTELNLKSQSGVVALPALRDSEMATNLLCKS